MPQTFKYETTTIDPTQSAMELSVLVQKYGGTRFELRWDNGMLAGVRFAIAHETMGEVPVRLPARIDEVKAVLLERKPHTYRMRKTFHQYQEHIATQAYRIAWRHLRDLCEQLLVATELGIIRIHEAFLWASEVEDPETGEVCTVGELLEGRGRAIGREGALRLIPGPEPEILEADFEVED